MSWRIAADLRDLFSDVVVANEKKAYLIRTLNRRDQLLSGLNEALALLPAEIAAEIKTLDDTTLRLRTDYSRVALAEHWGNPTAFITTEGFENLLEIGDGRRTHAFTLSPLKTLSLIPREFCFGLTERMGADGKIGKELDLAEIDALAEKLELAKIQVVAVCFLHANLNSIHEKQLGEILQSKGFTVFLSHDEKGHERERAEAVCARAFTSLGLETLKNETGVALDRVSLQKDDVMKRSDLPKNTLLVNFLESRIEFIVDPLDPQAVKRETSLSPLSKIEIDSEGLVHVGPERVETEPGPVALGKGIHLCLFDLFAHKNQFSAAIPRLKIDPARLTKLINPVVKQLRMDSETCVDRYLQLAQEMLSLEIQRFLPPGGMSLLITRGPFAPLFGPTLGRRLGIRKYLSPEHSAWSSTLDLLEGKLPSDVELLGDFKFVTSQLAPGEIHDL